jgi:hypothetical protein
MIHMAQLPDAQRGLHIAILDEGKRTIPHQHASFKLADEATSELAPNRGPMVTQLRTRKL